MQELLKDPVPLPKSPDPLYQELGAWESVITSLALAGFAAAVLSVPPPAKWGLQDRASWCSSGFLQCNAAPWPDLGLF